MSTPTDEGKRRYPETSGYNTQYRDPIACTCDESCASACTGECGCDACSVAFAEFCEQANFVGEEYVEDAALAAYRIGQVKPPH